MVQTELSATQRLDAIHARMTAAAHRANRSADTQLIAISKTQPVAAIEDLITSGQTVFGENRVQEAQSKWPLLRERHSLLSLHLVGQLQSNKADEAVGLFDAIHSLDRASLVAVLARSMDKVGRRPSCFIQVNLAEESQKGGCSVANLPTLLADARNAELPVFGLMTVPPVNLEPAPWFALLAKLSRDHGLSGLSMGMSGDFETAITLGATHVRVGTALFGDRAGPYLP